MSSSIRRLGAALALSAMAAAVVTTSAAYAAPAGPGGGAAPAPSTARSSPPDRHVYRGQASSPKTAAPIRPATPAPGVFTTDPSLDASSFSGTEPSIAVNPTNPNQIAITRFTFLWPGNADLLYSTDGGSTWAEEATIPAPPGIAAGGCPCDQTLDYGRDGRLYGTFLDESTSPPSIVTGSTTDPTSAAAWKWNGNPAQLTNAAGTDADQPWLIVDRDPTTASQDDAYVAYDDFFGGPTAHVAVSKGANPVNITEDSAAGNEAAGATNPGLRLGADHNSGTMYAMYEQSTGSPPQTVTYKVNRSTDGGATWSLNGSSDGLTVDTVPSDQAPGFKFGTVNALLGGVDHLAVDPTNGDVYAVYGQDVSGGNQIKIRRLTSNGSGGLTVGAASNVSISTNAALPSVAVASDGTIGVLYDSFDGIVNNLPTFSAHLARSTNHGTSFSDVVLESFSSPSADDGDSRQRVLGDYQQLKAVGTTFYGVFSGNRSGFDPTQSVIDPIFVKATPSTGRTTTTTLSSLANPSNLGQPVNFTATVSPVPDGGSVSFTVDGQALGAPVPVNTTTGKATSRNIAALLPGTHSVTASYTGDSNFQPSSSAPLSQVVSCPSTVTGQVNSPLSIGRPTCISNATVNADVTVQPGAPVYMTASTVNASFTATQAALVLICGSTLNNTLSVSASSGYVLVGDAGDDGPVACAANSTHSVTLTNNAGGVELGGNNANGDYTVNGTTGTAPLEGSTSEIEGNVIQGTLSCSGNNPAPTNDGHTNVASGGKSGQCASL